MHSHSVARASPKQNVAARFSASSDGKLNLEVGRFVDYLFGLLALTYLHLPFFTAASCAAQALEKSDAVATRVQPVPIGLIPVFHQIRQ